MRVPHLAPSLKHGKAKYSVEFFHTLLKVFMFIIRYQQKIYLKFRKIVVDNGDLVY